MGTDTPIAALSDKPRLLFDYFAQLFAPGTGAMDKFMKERLDPYIDKSGQNWSWRQDSRVARALCLSRTP